jgi:hypothetical protein
MSKSRFKVLGVLVFALWWGVLWGAAPALAAADSAQEIAWGDFVGAPTIPSNTIGLWVWSEEVDGQEILHVRAGSDGSAHTFSGTLRTNRVGNFYDAALVNETGDDAVTQTRFDTLTFSLLTTGNGEGLDVNWSGTQLHLDLQVDGAAQPAQIFYGAAGTAATGSPLHVLAGKEGLLVLPMTMLDGPTAFEKNVANGYFLYRTPNGRYHLRVTTTSTADLVLYRGNLRIEQGDFVAKRIILRDPGDFVRVVTPKRIEFRFLTKGYVDGMDWIVGGDGKPDDMVLTLKMGNGPAAPNVSLGSNPFGAVKAYTFRLVE